MPTERARRRVTTLAAIIVVFAGLRAASAMVVPVLFALFLAFVSSPLVFRLTRSRVPYPLAVTLVLLLELGVLATAGVMVGSSAARFESRLPVYRERLGALYSGAAEWLTSHGVDMRQEGLSEILDPGSLLDLMSSTVSSLGSMLGSLVLILLVLAFTLFDSARLWRKIEEHFAGGRAGDHVLGNISREVNRYLSVKTATSIFTGLLLGIWCDVMGVDFAVLWGLLAFLLNFVPTVGSILAAIPPVMVALVMHGPGHALAVMGGYLTVNMVIGNMIEPRVMGSALNMSPLVVLLSIVVWGWVLGPVGALLSAPLTMILKIALSNTDEWAWVAGLMSGPDKHPEVVPEVTSDANDASSGAVDTSDAEQTG